MQFFSEIVETFLTEKNPAQSKKSKSNSHLHSKKLSRAEIERHFVKVIRDLQNKRKYGVLDFALIAPETFEDSKADFLRCLEDEMQQELDASIAEDQRQLEKLNHMLDRINNVQWTMKKSA